MSQSKRSRKPASRKRFFAWSGLALATLLVGAAAFFVWQRKNANDQSATEVSSEQLLTEMQNYSAAEQHDKVVEVMRQNLSEHFRDNVEALRLFAHSRTMVSTPGNTHLTDAIQTFQRIVSIEPDDYASKKQLFYLYRLTGDNSKALKWGKEAAEKIADDVNFQTMLASSLLEDSQTDEAIQILDTVLQSEQGDPEIYRLRIRAMIETAEPRADILDFITQSASNPKGPDENQLLLVYAEETGNGDAMRALLPTLENLPASTPEQAVWTANYLDRSDRPSASAELLRQAAEQSNSPELALAIACRHLQSDKFDEIQTLFEDDFSDQQHWTEEIIILHGLSEWLREESPESSSEVLKKAAKRLSRMETMLSRTWLPVLESLSQVDVQPEQLLDATNAAIRLYPRSCYLHYLQATAFSRQSEKTLAVESYRRAIRLAPRWGRARVDLARVLIQQGDYRVAFMEASNALRSNPQSNRGFEAFLNSSLRLIEQGDRLPSDQMSHLIGTLKSLRTSQDDRKSQLTSAILSRLQGDEQKTQERIRAFLENQDEVSQSEASALRSLTRDNELHDAIDLACESTLGPSLEKIVALGSKETSDEAALKLIDSMEANGKPLDPIFKEVAKAESLTARNSKQAPAAWLALVERHDDIPIVHRAMARMPTNAFDARRTLIAKLRDRTSEEGLAWQLAEIKLLLDEDKSEKTTAKVILKANRLLKQAPSSIALYVLTAEAYSRLNQPRKVISTLEKAVERGVNHPVLRLQLAETHVADDQAHAGVPHALAAMDHPAADFSIRQRAIQVLLDAEEFEQAANCIRKDIPETLQDNDVDLMMFTAYVVACTQAQLECDASKLVGSLPTESDRWFERWIELANDRMLDVETSIHRLTTAKAWVGDSNERRRQLVYAIVRRANSSTNQNAIREALEIQSAISGELTPQDRLTRAMMLQAIGDEEKAYQAYVEISRADVSAKWQAIALNNLANLHLDRDEPQKAEPFARKALKTDKRPEVIDTLAAVLERSGRIDDAITLLKRHADDKIENLPLWMRLASYLQKIENLDAAAEALKKANEISLRMERIPDKYSTRMISVEKRQRELIDERTLSETEGASE